MIIEPDKILTWQMVQPTIRKHKGETIPGKFELVEIPVPELKKGEVLVEVAGCGVGQTDLRHFLRWRTHCVQPSIDAWARNIRQGGRR